VNVTVAGRVHEDDKWTAPAGTPTGGACNSRRYVYNGTRGQTYYSASQDASGFQPESVVNNVSWPKVTSDTPLWQVEIPIIAASDSVTTLACPGADPGGGPNVQIDPNVDYEIVGFLKVNLFDTDIGWSPPLDPAHLPWSADGSAGVDQDWGFASGQNAGVGHPDCYTAGTATASDLGTAMCQPCNVVRGRIAAVTDFLAADQLKSTLVHVTDAAQVNDPGGGGQLPPPPPSGSTPTPTLTPTPAPAGDGTFQGRQDFATGPVTQALVADLNGDGKPRTLWQLTPATRRSACCSAMATGRSSPTRTFRRGATRVASPSGTSMATAKWMWLLPIRTPKQ
jgi:hypothetical protein